MSMNTPSSPPFVAALFRKTAKGGPMERPDNRSLSFNVGEGIEGDRNAHPLSPRQALVTRKEDLDEFGITPGDLRENIVIAGLLANEFVPGAELTLGQEVRLRLTFHCEPCKRIAHLSVPLHNFIGRRGILAVVTEGGSVQEGNPVGVRSEAFVPLPDIPFERFQHFIGKVPAGRVVTYREITIGIGVAESFMRAVPVYIKKADPALPVHRIVDTDGKIVAYTSGQRERLRAEGVAVEEADRLFANTEESPVSEGRVDLKRYLWTDASIYAKA